MKGIRVDRAILMNCTEDYNDDEEKKRTHPSLLEKAQAMDIIVLERSGVVDIPPNPPQPRRSVLEEVGNHEARVGKPTKRETTWAQHGGKVDTHDAKARMRHLEAVRARIMRARGRDKESLVRGRE